MPPNIDDATTSTDIIVREGSNVTLKCSAKGSPHPSIKWKRDDNGKISINKTLSGNVQTFFVAARVAFNGKFLYFLSTVVEWENETLEMTKVGRLDMGAYLCIASNGVPPSVSKRIKLSIDCKWIRRQKITGKNFI